MKFTKILLIAIILVMVAALSGCPLLEGEIPAVSAPSEPNLALDGQLEVHIIDVGQGDAHLIITPCERVIKVDGGDNNTRQDVVDYLNNLGIEHIDIVVVTHPHADHIGGLIGVLDEFSVGVIYKPDVPANLLPDTRTLERFMGLIESNEIETRAAVAGYVMWNYANVEIKVLSPSGGSYSRLNEYSLILSVTYGDTRAILTGDAYQSNEQWILTQDFEIAACILVLGHHGSNTSSYEGFLAAVNPTYAIVSAGRDNRHGHPHSAVIERVGAVGSAIVRTYEVGSIVAVSDGARFVVTYGRN